MSTHRSLNKLERRSYTTIHHTVEVEEEKPITSFTRDRFGKKHEVEGVLLGFLVFAGLFGVAAAPGVCAADSSGDSAMPRKGVMMTVDTEETGLVSLNERMGSGEEDRPVFYRDEAIAVDINEEGEPNLNTRF